MTTAHLTQRYLLLSVFSALLAAFFAPPAPAQNQSVTVKPALDNSLLINPGKGWVQYYGGSPNTNAYIAVGYDRVCWADIETSEGVYNWKPIDDFIRVFHSKGKKASFGVMNVSTGIGKQYVTPKWVFNAGAQPLAVPDSSSPTGHQIIPKSWTDPVFLQKMHDFITALGQRYNGNPAIAFIDIRDYGNWGEGHTGQLQDPSVILTPPESLKNNYLLPYIGAFPKTRLIVPWGSSYYSDIYAWAVSHGAGLRRDGILSKWSASGAEMIPAYGHSPAIYEYCNSYDVTKANGYWKPLSLSASLTASSAPNAPPESLPLTHYIEGGKPSYLQWDDQIFQDHRLYCNWLGNHIGYHFVLQQAALPTQMISGQPATVHWTWLNDGVAPPYQPCVVALALLDRNGIVVQKQWVSASAPGNWTPGVATTETVRVTFRGIPAGSYQLAVGLFTDQKIAAPDYLLGIQGKTPTGWYVLYSHVRVKR